MTIIYMTSERTSRLSNVGTTYVMCIAAGLFFVIREYVLRSPGLTQTGDVLVVYLEDSRYSTVKTR